MEWNTTKEDGKERHPLEVLQQARKESLLSQAVSQNGESDIGHEGEDDQQGEEDLPRVCVKLINVAVVPTDHEVVDNGEGKTSGNGVVGEDVTNGRDLGAERHGREQHAEEKPGERSLPRPGPDGVEDQLVNTIRIPTFKLVPNSD